MQKRAGVQMTIDETKNILTQFLDFAFLQNYRYFSSTCAVITEYSLGKQISIFQSYIIGSPVAELLQPNIVCYQPYSITISHIYQTD